MVITNLGEMTMCITSDMNKIISVFNEEGYIIFQVSDVKMKLPVPETFIGMRDTSNDFLTDLFSIQGVEEVFKKYGVIVEMTTI
jgi:hypothetical protein